MTVLIVGATGATGRLLVKMLLERGVEVIAIVRSLENLPDGLLTDAHLRVVTASILDMADAELADLLHGCDAVASCLGHNLNFRGIFGQPRKLVTQAVQRLCLAVAAYRPERPLRFILMNTAGNSNRDIPEPLSFSEKCVMSLIRKVIPPHSDNECAADFLRTQIPPDDHSIQWVVVRPDTLTNETDVSKYEVVASPTRSALFNPGKTSRINVAHFMAKLMTDDESWSRWRGKMPVIYNKKLKSEISLGPVRK